MNQTTVHATDNANTGICQHASIQCTEVHLVQLFARTEINWTTNGSSYISQTDQSAGIHVDDRGRDQNRGMLFVFTSAT